MTEVLNNFWNQFLMMNFFAPRRDKTRLINTIAADARESCRQAEEEARHGAAAQTALKDAADEKLRQSLAAIAVWHNERAAQKFDEAAELFSQIKNFRTSAKIREYFNRKSELALNRADECKVVARSLEK